MDKKLKIGLIGAGGIATGCHMPGYANMDNVEIVAICDIIPEKAEKLAKKYGVSRVSVFYWVDRAMEKKWGKRRCDTPSTATTARSLRTL